jgi:hypothetical protein
MMEEARARPLKSQMPLPGYCCSWRMKSIASPPTISASPAGPRGRELEKTEFFIEGKNLLPLRWAVL